MMSEVFLRPGELSFETRPTRIVTVLGSCIAVCIFDQRKKIGGMCHYYLPEPAQDKIITENEEDKYGVFAIKNLLRHFKENGSRREDLLVKVVGGGHVLSQIAQSDDAVGSANIKMARQIIRQFGLRIAAESVGGFHGRKVRFYSESGKLELKRIEKSEENSIAGPVTKPSPSSFRYNDKIKVLIVDDSKPVRLVLRKMLEKDSLIEIVGEAVDGIDAEEKVKQLNPDLLTLDIHMPRMDGLTFLGRLMQSHPIPAIIVTAMNLEASGDLFTALEKGAFDYIQKPEFSNMDEIGAELISKIKEAKSSGYGQKKIYAQTSGSVVRSLVSCSSDKLNKSLFVLGASTGGTEALKHVLEKLPPNIPPTLIVQHIPPIFSKAFADRLNSLCPFTVREAQDGDLVERGVVLLAPGGKHMRLKKQGADRYIVQITEDPPVNRFRPSVDYLFESVARNDLNFTNVCAGIFTGMGYDGAKGLLALKNKGAATFAQNEETCVVYGMPKAAKEIGAVSYTLSLDAIAGHMTKFLNSL